MVYHGILLDASFEGIFLKSFKILGRKRSETNPWIMSKVEVRDEDIEKVIETCKDNLMDGPYYCHFYKYGEIIVVFKKRVFRITQDKSSWKPVIEYGLSIGIPLEQLDIKPNKFEDETY